MATRGSKGKGTSGSDSAGVSPAYYQELKETFQLYDTEHRGVLSTKKLRLAMRTLGFEATMDEIEEIVQEMPSLSVHQTKKRPKNKQRAMNGKGTQDRASLKSAVKESESSVSASAAGARRSSRTAAVASRSGQKKYADSDDESSGDDEDAYEDEREGAAAEEEEDTDDNYDGQLYFTLKDFITIMSPNEEQHAQDEVSRVFQLFDTQGKGSIRIEDLRRVATELNIPLKDEELREMIEEADRDGTGGVKEQEFAKIMKKTGF
ncbi:hypothetical protein BC939DRAFT_439052 [Gamsiella multidivaricata]|uniref:uncharacterized protein n=1 Tax=Gamsiella multidivaricata TaxID=101098 RepID=UPI0022208DA9|nr:uncharacterized protein BC939DRAFT_439052 [Gamsiella multidivaricata]KAG0358542.1 hypothetical protein BGZ54_010374 [Gamsiella multidivaricata]KAI7830343.1 hypothetical protein BC939DRAFT_439052 [Gamsiella multidivaricata]